MTEAQFRDVVEEDLFGATDLAGFRSMTESNTRTALAELEFPPMTALEDAVMLGREWPWLPRRVTLEEHCTIAERLLSQCRNPNMRSIAPLDLAKRVHRYELLKLM